MNPSTILIVDDEPHMRRLTEFSLRRGGYDRFFFAQNGREALSLAASEKPDLIIMDFMMPEMNGLGALHALKHSQSTAPIPVIMVSGCGEFHAKVNPVSLGATDVLTKPYSPTLLLETAQRALNHCQPVLPA